jgi:hypothetical protein
VLVVAAAEDDLAATRQRFTLSAAFSVVAGVGSPGGATPLTVYRVSASADTCP